MFLGHGTLKKKKFMDERISIVIEMIRSFAFAGIELTMTAFNKAGKVLLKPPRLKGSNPDNFGCKFDFRNDWINTKCLTKMKYELISSSGQ